MIKINKTDNVKISIDLFISPGTLSQVQIDFQLPTFERLGALYSVNTTDINY